MPTDSVCFVNSNRAWGGGEKWHLAHACHLRDKGCRVTVVAAPGSVLAARAAQEPGIESCTLRLGNLGFLNPLLFARLWVLFRSRRVSTVLLGLPRDLKTAGPAARLAGVPRVIYRRGMGVAVKNSAANRFLYGRVLTGLIVNSQDTRRAVLSANAALIPPERMHLLPNAVALPEESLPEPGTRLIRRSPGDLVIGNAGRLVTQKGQTHLLDAAAVLARRGVRFKLAVAGEGPLRGALEEQARRLGLADKVCFLGFVRDMRRFYREIDVLAFPSLWEGFANAPLEAMAAGRPVVAFAVSSLPELVRHGENGFLTPCGDAESLADALAGLADQELRAALGENGRRLVREQYAPEVLFPAFERIVFGRELAR